jgi:phosphatidylinositol glycan class P protein
MSLNYIATPPPYSLNTLFDEYTRAPMKVVGVPQSVHQDDMPIHAISDIPIFTVNSLVFGNNNVE